MHHSVQFASITVSSSAFVLLTGSASAGPTAGSPVPLVGQQLAMILYIQADKFLQQVKQQLLKLFTGKTILRNLLDDVTDVNYQR